MQPKKLEMMNKQQNNTEGKPISEKILAEPVKETASKNFAEEPVSSIEEPVIFKSSLVEPLTLHLTLTKSEPDNLPKDADGVAAPRLLPNPPASSFSAFLTAFRILLSASSFCFTSLMILLSCLFVTFICFPLFFSSSHKIHRHMGMRNHSNRSKNPWACWSCMRRHSLRRGGWC